MADDEAIPLKVVFIGETAVGKSCLLSRYSKGEFLENFVPTLGGSFVTKTIEIETDEDVTKRVKFELWDTAGQEKYRSITKQFYNNADACIFVYDITRKDSYKEIKEYWLSEVKTNTKEDIILAMAGNKSDLYEYEEVDKEDVDDFCKEQGIIFKPTSAKENQGIDELFNLVALKMVDPEAYEDTLLGVKERKRKKIKKDKEAAAAPVRKRSLESQGSKLMAGVKQEKKGCCGGKS